jgi:hypothetical protein
MRTRSGSAKDGVGNWQSGLFAACQGPRSVSHRPKAPICPFDILPG